MRSRCGRRNGQRYSSRALQPSRMEATRLVGLSVFQYKVANTTHHAFGGARVDIRWAFKVTVINAVPELRPSFNLPKDNFVVHARSIKRCVDFADAAVSLPSDSLALGEAPKT